jgi:formylglycine-generating enzyme required for sulfatase activity
VTSRVAPRRAHGRLELPLVVDVPGGAFTMGHADIFESEAPNPPHDVVLSPFAIGVHPVTNEEYAAFLRATAAPPHTPVAHARFGAGDRPVIGVSWEDARRYCAWAAGDLPTEAQWELAARGWDGRRYPWGDDPPDESRACFAEDWNSGCPGRAGEHSAGVSPFGGQDMAGGVWEWCLDVFRPDAHVERARLRVDPSVTGAGRVRPLRGGCWRSIDCKLQAAYRNWSHEAARHTTIGFRLCVPGS